MAVYQRHIEASDPLNEVPSDFSVAEGSRDWTVQEAAWAANGRAARFGHGSSGAYSRLILPSAVFAHVAETRWQILVRFRFTGGDTTDVRVSARYPDAGSVSVMLAGLRPGNHLTIDDRGVASSFTNVSSTSHPSGLADTSLILVFTGVPDGQMVAELYDEASESLQASTSIGGFSGATASRDPKHAGQPNLQVFSANASRAPMWDYFAFGTDGDDAPWPDTADAPGVPTDLHTSDVTPTSARLNWSAP